MNKNFYSTGDLKGKLALCKSKTFLPRVGNEYLSGNKEFLSLCAPTVFFVSDKAVPANKVCGLFDLPPQE